MTRIVCAEEKHPLNDKSNHSRFSEVKTKSTDERNKRTELISRNHWKTSLLSQVHNINNNKKKTAVIVDQFQIGFTSDLVKKSIKNSQQSTGLTFKAVTVTRTQEENERSTMKDHKAFQLFNDKNVLDI